METTLSKKELDLLKRYFGSFFKRQPKYFVIDMKKPNVWYYISHDIHDVYHHKYEEGDVFHRIVLKEDSTIIGLLKTAIPYLNDTGCFVIDLKEKSIELFEPHSKTTELSTLDSLEGAYTISNRLLRKTFSEILPKYSYIAPNDYLPRYGLQSKTDAYTGLCITWSMIYVHYRILNPEKSRKEIIKHMNKIKRRFILRYAGYVEQLIKNKI